LLQELKGILVARIETFRDLIVWQKGMDLAEAVHRATAGFPPADLYTLGTQLRRAAGSVPANVAEGFSRRSRATYRHHVAIAHGSQAELQTHLDLARRLNLIATERAEELLSLASEVGRLLNGLWRALAPVTVCYSWLLYVLGLGLGPGALGLQHGFPLLPKP
jgi:four helix bundle protein